MPKGTPLRSRYRHRGRYRRRRRCGNPPRRLFGASGRRILSFFWTILPAVGGGAAAARAGWGGRNEKLFVASPKKRTNRRAFTAALYGDGDEMDIWRYGASRMRAAPVTHKAGALRAESRNGKGYIRVTTRASSKLLLLACRNQNQTTPQVS